MTDDPIGTEANQAAHRVAKAAKKYLELTQQDSARPAYWQLRQEVKRYEEIGRRAQREATA